MCLNFHAAFLTFFVAVIVYNCLGVTISPNKKQPNTSQTSMHACARTHTPHTHTLCAAFMTFFLAVIVYNRLEFTISRDDKWQAAQEAEKVATLMQSVNGVMDGKWRLRWGGGASRQWGLHALQCAHEAPFLAWLTCMPSSPYTLY